MAGQKRKAKSGAEKRKRHKKVKSGAMLVPPDDEERTTKAEEEEYNIEYVIEEVDTSDPLMAQFADVYQKFQQGLKSEEEEVEVEEEQKNANTAVAQIAAATEVDENAEPKISRRQRRRAERLSVAHLKQLVETPEVVEAHDANAADPKLLIQLKAQRNTVPVPIHWSQKRKYLQSKRGFEKPPFQLPAFIADTGIQKIRDAIAERESQKRAKLKAQEKIRPRANKIDIDYQVLHDAFFKYQTKPKMSRQGELYFEGKELEVRLPEHKAGALSDRLKQALGMPDGAPPPWLVNMQRYGMPPSYPHSKIPGLSSPLPPGAVYGYHPGGWGRPPVDERGRPLYGDPFGLDEREREPKELEEWKKPFGELQDVEEEEEVEEEVEAAPGMAPDEFERGIASVAPSEAAYTEGISSVFGAPSTVGTETPDMINLRKVAREGEARQLFTVLEQQQASVHGRVMGSTYTYQLPGAAGGMDTPVDGASAADDVDAEEVVLDEARRRLKKEEKKDTGYKNFKF